MTTNSPVLNDVIEDSKAVVETASKVNLFTPKRLLIVGAVALAVTGTVLIVKKARAAKVVEVVYDEEV